MKVSIEKIKDNSEEEMALLRVFKVNETIKKAVDLLKNSYDSLVLQNIDSGENEKIYIHEVIYAEYLERNVFLYTEEATYSLRMSLIKFMETYGQVFIQIKKNLVLNSYFLQSFATTKSGNLMVMVTSGEKLVVSRRYVKTLKEALAKLANTEYD